jgi:hypothetical protein
MTRVATAANEAELLELARCSTAAQLERICRFYSQARRSGQDAGVVEDERRWVVSRPTEDGMVSIQIRLLPDEAARLMRAIELGADHGSLADGAVALAGTDYGYSAEMRDGELVFLDPDGHEIPAVVRRLPIPDGSFDRLRALIEHHGIAISAETNAPGWDGLPVDYDACVNAIGGWDAM